MLLICLMLLTQENSCNPTFGIYIYISWIYVSKFTVVKSQPNFKANRQNNGEHKNFFCFLCLSLQVVALSFDFPFYGHYLKQITIATGGTSDFLADVGVTFTAYVHSSGGVL